MSQLVFHRVVRVRLGFLRFKEVFEFVKAVLSVWLQTPLVCELVVLTDIRICFALTLKLLSPVLILFELCFRRSQARRQFVVFYLF